MVISGRVRNGMIVLDGGATLPEGVAVTVTFPALANAKPVGARRRIQVPLVPSDEPGSIELTGARIAEILDQEDASPRR